MGEAIIVGLIAAAASILAAIITSRATQKKVQNELHEQVAVQSVKIEKLTEEVEKIGGVSVKIPVIEEKIKVINHRIDDLERKTA